ncbi:MAG: 50S ribosomal protein L18Ae [Candidatus Nanohaloarchaea archaeon]
MPTYRFSGKISLGRGVHGFERQLEAESLSHAEEKLFSELGSEHSVPRSKIEIDESGKLEA